MDVSIIIVNYNTRELLKDCINSIYAQDIIVKYEVIVVDNDSKDESCKLISECFPEVILVESQENLGFGRANNLGIKYASGDYIFFLNSDTILLNNAIDYFYEFCQQYSHIKIGALGSILLNLNRVNCHSYGPFITIKSLLVDILDKYLRIFKLSGNENKSVYLFPPDVEDYKSVDYITGADLFVPRTVIDEIDAFDPSFFMYCEEVDWQKRMSLSGYNRYVISGPKILHLEGASAPSKTIHRSLNRIYNIFKSQILYIYKYNSYYKYLTFRICFAFLWTAPILFREGSLHDKFKVLKVLFSPVCK